MNLPLKITHFPDCLSVHLPSTPFIFLILLLNTAFSACRYSAIPLNLRLCFRMGLVTALSCKASLKTSFAVRSVITSGGELEIRNAEVVSAGDGEGVTCSEIVRKTR